MNKISQVKENFNPKDWVTVTVSILALATSFANTIFQMKVNFDNQQNQKNQDERAQAINVSHWYNNVGNDDYDKVTLNNSNKNAIYDVFVFYVSNRSEGKLSDISKLVQYASDDDFDKYCDYFEILPPGETTTKMPADRAMGGERFIPEMIFKDSNGVTWFRNKNGNLEKCSNIYKILPKYGIPAPYFQYEPIK